MGRDEPDESQLIIDDLGGACVAPEPGAGGCSCP
jgi:hypothetical protein